MSRGRLAACGLLALFLLHNDLWWWHDPRLVLGLPIGLAYHLAFCFVAALVLALAAYPRPEAPDSASGAR